ncbi:MAG: FMN-binding protein, partial [Candidatus Hydrogenedens sp.]
IDIIKQITLFLLFSSPLCFLLARWIYKRKSIRKGKEKIFATTLETYFAILAIGTIGMGISILLLIQFQYCYGTLSTYIGLLSSMFMLGLSTSPITFNSLYADKNHKQSFFVVFSLFSICAIYTLAILFELSVHFYTYLVILFLWGLSLGFLLSMFLNTLDKESTTSQIAVNLEIWDHLGAGLGAFIFPIILLPLFGLQFSVGFILLSLLLVLLFIPLLQTIPVCKSSSWGRVYGYTLFPILVLCFISTEIYHRSTVPLPGDAFTKIAQELSDGGKLQLETITLPDNRQLRYYTVTKKDENQNKNISYIFSTASLFKVIGYGGEMDIAVKVSREGNIENIKVIQSNETPDYLSRVEDYFFLYKGKNIFQPESISEIDSVSGATTTADAVKRAVQFAGKEFAQIIQSNNITQTKTSFNYDFSAPTTYSIYIFLLFILLAIIFRFFHSDLLRTLWLICVVLILGFWLNIQYGLYFIVQLLYVDKLQFHLNVPTLLIIGIPVLILINGNIYCGYLCPFGALSELISKLDWINKKIIPTKQTWYITRQFKYILAFVFFSTYFFKREVKMIDIDPLLSFFTLDISNYITIFGICVLLASFLYNRFWCRVLCPTGAFLSLIQSLRIFSFFWQKTFPTHCDLGISRPEEIDCIQCNRCYKHEKK